MACKIPYLDNNYQGEQLKQLRQKHINIVKEVISSKLFYRIGETLQLSIDKTSDIRKKQEQFVESIPELDVISKNNKDILSLKVDKDVLLDAGYVNNKYNYSTQKSTQDNNIDRWKGNNIKDVLENITNPELKLLANVIKEHITEKQLNIPIVLSDSMQSYERAIYTGNQIIINRNGLFPKGNSEKTLMHEIMHVVTVGWMNNNKNTELYRDLEKIYKHVYNQLGELKPFYAFSNLEEFVAESFTNSEFIKELMMIESVNGVREYNNIFEQFVDAISKIFKRLFNIKDGNVYTQVSGIISSIIQENADFENSLLTFDDELYYDIDGETLRENHEFADYLNESPENEQKFIPIISSLKKRFNDYITLLQEGSVEYPSSDREIKLAELKELRNLLNDNNVEDAIIGLNKYVTQSVNWIHIIYNEFFEQGEFPNVIDRVKAVADTRNEDEIYALSKIINKSVQFLYLFQGLSDFKDELQRDGFVPKDKFNSKFFGNVDLFKNEFKNYLNEDKLESIHKIFETKNLSINDFKSLIINAIIDEDSTLIASELENIRKSIDQIFIKTTKKTFTSQMSEALGKASKLQADIKDVHYKLITEWLYPEYDDIQKKNYDESSDKYINKRKFEALLKIANEDENFLTSWLEATIQSKDPLVNMVAKKISNALNDVHKQNVKVAEKIGDARKDFKQLSLDEQKKAYNDFVHLIDVLVTDVYGDPVELELESDEHGLIVDTLEGKKKFALKKVKAFKTSKHTSLISAHSNITTYLLYRNKEGKKGIVKELLEHVTDENGILDEKGFKQYLLDNIKTFPYLYDVAKTLYGTSSDGFLSTSNSMLEHITENDDSVKLIKSIIETSLWKQMYYNKVAKSYSTQEVTNIVNSVPQEDRMDFVLDNTREASNINSLLYLIRNKIDGDVMSIEQDGEIKYLIKDRNIGKLSYLSYNTLKTLPLDDLSFFYKKYELVDVKDEFKLQEYNGEHKQYFNELYEIYKQHNKTLGKQRLKHSIIPQIEKTGISDAEELSKEAKSLFESIYDWFVNAYNSIIKAWSELNNTAEYNESQKTVFEQEYLNGDKVKSVPLNYNKILDNQDNVEWDLAVSVGAYSFMTNQYNTLKQYDPQMKLISTIVKGDVALGIEQRKARKTDVFNRIVKRRKRGRNDEDNFKKIVAENLNAKVIEFIDDMMYGENDYLAFGLGNITSKQIEKSISGYAAYTSLAFNIIGMLSNITNGKVSTYLEAIQGKYFTLKEFGDAELEYYKNAPEHFKDFMSNDLKDKSKIGQLLVILDAIQGEYLDDFQSVLQKKKWSDAPKTALFFTQNGAEHYIQTVNMIAMLKAEGLWDSIEYKEGEVLQFTQKEWEKLREFQGKLHSVNKRLNGAYAKVDKARLQRRWFGRLILTFRKYIWQMYKARFGGERLDVESGDVTRGYVMSYYEQLIKDIKSNQSIAWKAMRGVKQLGIDTKRFALGTANLFSFNQLNKSEQFNKLYGFEGMNEEQISEARRYIAEVSLYTMFTFLGLFLGSLEDDEDEEKSALLGNLELLAKRQRSDMGAFLPTMINASTGMDIGAFNTFDFIRKTVSSPIPAMRSVDNSISVLSQLTGVDYVDGELNFTFNDVYEKSGKGYEAGDKKIVRQLQKSVVAPYWQILKLMNPSEQLQFLNMVNKNSK